MNLQTLTVVNLTLLSGSWSDITAFNYAIDPFALRPFVPSGTELDLFEDQAYLSVVALCFGRPRLLGAIPLMPGSVFPLVTLRFYVKRHMPDGTFRRGTAFLKEFTSHASVQTFGRLLGKNDLQRAPVKAHVIKDSSYLFWWGRIVDNNWLEAKVSGTPDATRAGSFEEFIFEKNWDFVPFTAKRTLQYRALHPRWKVWQAQEAEARIDVSGLVSGDIARVLKRAPTSAFVAKGSSVRMSFPTVVRTPSSLTSRTGLHQLQNRRVNS